MNIAANAERGTHSAPPVLLCLGWNYFFFVVFLAAFFAAFLVAILPILPIDLTSTLQLQSCS
jgi:hypothetical protein